MVPSQTNTGSEQPEPGPSACTLRNDSIAAMARRGMPPRLHGGDRLSGEAALQAGDRRADLREDKLG
eukprot:4697803-Prymnesium_polylepis.1